MYIPNYDNHIKTHDDSIKILPLDPQEVPMGLNNSKYKLNALFICHMYHHSSYECI